MIMKENLIKKLTSRKFIVTVITAIAGVITMIIGDNEVVQIISGAAMTIVPTVVYCLMEGVIEPSASRSRWQRWPWADGTRGCRRPARRRRCAEPRTW